MDSEVLQTIDPRQLGARLREARKTRGYTQQAAAERLGVARTTMTAIEKGDRRVRPSEVICLAALYGRAVGELLRRGEPVESFADQLRALLGPELRDDARLLASITEFQLLCEDYLELERLRNSRLAPRHPPPYAIGGVDPDMAAEDVAIEERHRLGIGDGPVLNMRELLENDVGLRIFYMDLPPRIASMFACTDQLSPCVAVSRNHPDEQRRQSLGHAYGHFLFSRYRPEVTLVGRYQRRPRHERAADAFAQAFLMPASGLSRRFHQLQRGRQGRITPADLQALAHSYLVSLEALIQRLEALRLLPAVAWDRLQWSVVSVGDAREAPQPSQPRYADHLLPLRYMYLAAEAFECVELSEGQLTRFLRTDRLDARRLLQELSVSMIVSDDGTVGRIEIDLGVALQEQAPGEAR